MRENDSTIILICIALICISLSNIIKSFRITDLEHKIEELEKQSKEVHEYILNRIGE